MYGITGLVPSDSSRSNTTATQTVSGKKGSFQSAEIGELSVAPVGEPSETEPTLVTRGINALGIQPGISPEALNLNQASLSFRGGSLFINAVDSGGNFYTGSVPLALSYQPVEVAPAVQPNVALPALPLKAVYIGYKGINWGSPGDTVIAAAQAGFNVIILAFLLQSGPADMCIAWAGMTAAARQAVMAQVHALGAVVIVSAGGATDQHFYSTNTATVQAYANYVANWSMINALDGVDIDAEGLGVYCTYPPANMSGAEVVQCLATCFTTLRATLGPNAIITAAPQFPYLGPIGTSNPNVWAGPSGGYVGVEAAVGPNCVNCYLVQYYNSGLPPCTTTLTTLFHQSCSTFPSTSIQELATAGIPINKLVLGKILLPSDGSYGYITANELQAIIAQAPADWNAGVMLWLWDTTSSPTAASWVQTVFQT
eukprot:gnl/Hemi2/23622_TR7927_c0_g1_i1.p1 gnl/Hemi2/23622_TR7927_c0_g1~~gnl/Hemi2/23622_TR7927_c0_g1_i1.p1  ORF type:complete len:437 (+),score=0.11 gnl/Hemi2/23622_TR7927_c0_g1_i1:33-1313(+)